MGRRHLHDSGWYPHRRCVGGHVAHHDRIGTDPRVRADAHGTKDFCARANIDMPFKGGHTGAIRADRHLLEQQAIGADLRAGRDHDAVGMGQKKSTANVAVQRDVRAGDDRPEAMSPLRQDPRQWSQWARCALPRADSRQQRTRRIPMPPSFRFPAPVRFQRGDCRPPCRMRSA